LAKSFLVLTTKIFSPHPTDGIPKKLVNFMIPCPPANKMTEATGLSGFIRMNSCLMPGRVSIRMSLVDRISAFLEEDAITWLGANKVRNKKIPNNLLIFLQYCLFRLPSSLFHKVCDLESKE
jgi:hypothetical protein